MTTDAMPYRYTAYGLGIESSLRLPELTPSPATGNPDVIICEGEVPASLPVVSTYGAAWQSAPGRLLLTVAGVGRYLIIDNREIRVHRLDGCSDGEVRTFLIGSVFAAVLHARRLLVLHASAIETERGAVLFMGRCGAGKSTLLAAFLQRGYSMLADDKVAVTLDSDGLPSVTPGFRTLRLAEAAARVLGFPVGDACLEPRVGKYTVAVEPPPSRAVRLHAAYALQVNNGSTIALEPLAALERFHALDQCIYRRRFASTAAARAANFRILSAAADHVRVAVARRPHHPVLIHELCARLEDDLRV